MSDSQDRIFNSMSRYLEEGRGNDWGSNRVWVNDPQNTVAICHNDNPNYAWDRFERSPATLHRWEMIDLAQKVRNEKRVKKMTQEEIKEMRKRDRIRNNAKWYESKEEIKRMWREDNQRFLDRREKASRAKASAKAGDLLKEKKAVKPEKRQSIRPKKKTQRYVESEEFIKMLQYTDNRPANGKLARSHLPKFNLEIPISDAHQLLAFAGRPVCNGTMLQSLLDLYYDRGYIKSNVIVDGETTKTHYKLIER